MPSTQYKNGKLIITTNKPDKTFQKPVSSFKLPILDDIPLTYLALTLVTVTGSGRKSIRARPSGALPITGKDVSYTLVYGYYQGLTRPSTLNWTKVKLQLNLQDSFDYQFEPIPNANYVFYLEVDNAGQVKDLAEAYISTPSDTVFTSLSGILSDDTLSKSEKPYLKLQYDQILAVQPSLITVANAWAGKLDIAYINNYNTAVSNLTAALTSLNPAYTDYTQDTALATGGGLALMGLFTAVANAEAALQGQVDGLAKSNIDDIFSDDRLTPNEKRQIKSDYDTIKLNQTRSTNGLDSVATSLGVSSSIYDTAITALETYLATLSSWSNSSKDWVDYTSTVDLGSGGGSALRAKFVAVYMAQVDLEHAIDLAANNNVLAQATADTANALNTAKAYADSQSSTYKQQAIDAINSSVSGLVSGATTVAQCVSILNNTATYTKVSALPNLPDAGYPAGKLVSRTSDNTLWRSTGSAWDQIQYAASSLFGQVSADQINVTDTLRASIVDAAHVRTAFLTISDSSNNGGTIQIGGGSIKAQAVTLSHLNFTPVTGALNGQVIGAINASTEGLTISAAKLQISGSCIFAAGYDPTAKISSGGAAADINNNSTTINGGKITAGTVVAGIFQTAGYTETSGYATAGAKLDSTGTALKVAPSGLMVGQYTIGDAFFRSLNALDGSQSAGLTFYRGGNDTGTRTGAPNASCLSLYSLSSQCLSGVQLVALKYVITPTSYSTISDNLDGLRYLRLRFYQSTASTSSFFEWLQPITDRTYAGSSIGTGSTQGCILAQWRNSNGKPNCENSSYLYSGYIRANLINVYGSSADIDFGPTSTEGGLMPAASITGQTPGGYSGGGQGGGNCPAPYTLVDTLDYGPIPASEVKVGMRVKTQHETTLDQGIYTVTSVGPGTSDVWTLQLVDGRKMDFAYNHRFYVPELCNWVQLCDLEEGLILAGSRPGTVKQTYLKKKDADTVKITVAGAHTYETSGILSHNIKILTMS